MCFSIFKLNSVMKLCISAQQVQKLIDEGTLAEAFDKNRKGEAHTCIVTFNLLAESAATVANEHKDISPFLRYRREILAESEIGWHLRKLVRNLAGGDSVNLFALFGLADAQHMRIALECIAHAARSPIGAFELSDLILSNEQQERRAA